MGAGESLIVGGELGGVDQRVALTIKHPDELTTLLIDREPRARRLSARELTRELDEVWDVARTLNFKVTSLCRAYITQ